MKPDRIRNFSIIAHIDHGKSTLADRILELTGALTSREMEDQVLDDMALERERGITIKARTVALNYRARDGKDYLLNLIDTPGHVDFSYEVSRSLAACEAALLLVDASQGVEAQTLANAYLALENNLEILPVINKIDLPSADVDRVREQLENIVGVKGSEALLACAKDGRGVPEILEAIVKQVPAPAGDPQAPCRALIFDSWYDQYRGVVVLIRILDGSVAPGMRIRFLATGLKYEVEEVGIFTPKLKKQSRLSAGEVGYLIAGIKKTEDTRIGDTITEDARPTSNPFPGFQKIKPMVFAGIYPTDNTDFEVLRDGLEKLHLNDPAFTHEPETSTALGFGFRCGFLGMLHMEIVQQRLEREFGLDLIQTAPGVRYLMLMKDGTKIEISNPAKLPSVQAIDKMMEPFVTATILTQPAFVGGILTLVEGRRGIQKELRYLTPERVLLVYELPLNEIITDFYDRLKTVSRGYASFDYQLSGWWESKLVKLDILVNGDPLDALSLILHRDRAYQRGRWLCSKMRQLIPRQMFEVVIQAALGHKVIARESVSALRKNVIAKCYGGDVTRKRKLLEKQKEGKKR
ncbi:MAG: translation elongation factor 4, partial [Acidobacteria bacterium]|nr:translation elongation factor 4 [Acidobacteriota bacterium]